MLKRSVQLMEAAPPVRSDLGDLRFRKLLGAEAWSQLPRAVRLRFSKRLSGTAAAIYRGEIAETRMSRTGWLFAQLARLIGGPLPLARHAGVPAVVAVTEDAASGGQVWTRIYGRRGGFPQTINSAKRFAGKTGLEEYVGRGIGMALKVEADERGIHFRSAFYFFALGPWRVTLPRWLCPGTTRVSHIDMGDGRFTFVLDLVHPLLGELIHQTAIFQDE